MLADLDEPEGHCMPSIIICEKPSQARQISDAVGNRYGRIIPLRGHVIRLAEPNEVNPAWDGPWTTDLLWPGHFFPTRVSSGDGMSTIVNTVKSALAGADHVIVATDPDREGQLIGDELLQHLKWQGRTSRVIFVAVDPASIRKAFEEMRPDSEFANLFASGQSRQQSDQMSNLTLTRVATKALMTPGSRGVIGIGRVKTPTLGIVCQREQEILNFKPQDYFEVGAHASADSRKVLLTCGRLPKELAGAAAEPDEGEEKEDVDEALEAMEELAGKIMDRRLAEGLAASVKDTDPRLVVQSSRKRTGPPPLFDLTSLQGQAATRFGFSAERTLQLAQSLYETYTLTTYPRSEAQHLPESAIEEISPLVEALMEIPAYSGFAPLVNEPVVRKGASGHFSDKKLEGMSHFAIIPNFAVAPDIARIAATLPADEAKLFDMIARRYMAAIAPDYVYRHTSVHFDHSWAPPGAPHPASWRFETSGNVPVEQGWRAIDGGKLKDGDNPLDDFRNGEAAHVDRTEIFTRTTRPPARYNEGSLIIAMKEVWRLVPEDKPELRGKLKETKGIGTPATRAGIVAGLMKQGQLEKKGKNVVPSAAGMELWKLLRAVCPNVVDPARTAAWETLFSRVEAGQMSALEAVGRIVQDTDKERLRIMEAAGKGGTSIAMGKPGKPDQKFIDWAERLARAKNIPLPKEVRTDRAACSKFIDEHRPRDADGNPVKAGEGKPTQVQVDYARDLAERTGMKITASHLESSAALKAFIDEARAVAPPSDKQVNFARKLAQENGVEIDEATLKSAERTRAFIDRHLGGGKGGKGASGARGGKAAARAPARSRK